MHCLCLRACCWQKGFQTSNSVLRVVFSQKNSSMNKIRVLVENSELWVQIFICTQKHWMYKKHLYKNQGCKIRYPQNKWMQSQSSSQSLGATALTLMRPLLLLQLPKLTFLQFFRVSLATEVQMICGTWMVVYPLPLHRRQERRIITTPTTFK